MEEFGVDFERELIKDTNELGLGVEEKEESRIFFKSFA